MQRKCLLKTVSFLHRRGISVKFSNYRIRRSVDQGIQTLLRALDSRTQFESIITKFIVLKSVMSVARFILANLNLT